VLGPLAPEERRTVNSMYWSPPLLRYQLMTMAGAALTIAGLVGINVVELTAAPHSGVPPLLLPLTALLLAGGSLLIAGLVLRGRTFRAQGTRSCPVCEQPNLVTAPRCRKCGAPLDRPRPARGKGPSRPTPP